MTAKYTYFNKADSGKIWQKKKKKMQKSGCCKNGYKYVKLSKKQFVVKMATKYAKLNNGQFGAKFAKIEYAKVRL